jgi:hypothetical protein
MVTQCLSGEIKLGTVVGPPPRDLCTVVRVAQHVCVYEWTNIYISGIAIANIYCMHIVILYGIVCK